MPRNQQGADATAPARAGGQREEAGTAGIGALDPGPGAAAQASGKSVSRAGGEAQWPPAASPRGAVRARPSEAAWTRLLP